MKIDIMETGRERGLLSFIIPAYNEQDMIPVTARTIGELMEKNHIPFEILFIDDGSKDATWSRIQDASMETAGVRGIHFSKNFGKEAAMFAGLASVHGDCAVVMDCDLQHPPEKVVEMYGLWQEGYEVIEAVKSDRGKESQLHSVMAGLFYKIISKASHLDMENASDFKLLDRKAINALLMINEKHAFFRALSSWIGFKTTTVEFEVQERMMGESKWSPWSLFRYALTNISSFSAFPMQAVTLLGILTLLVSLILGSISLYQKLAGIALDGFTTVIIVELFVGSVIMISLGVIGYYIAQIYEEIKGRPRYIISERCGDEI